VDRKKVRRAAVVIACGAIFVIVSAVAYFTAMGRSSPEKARPLVVSSSAIEGDQLLISIALKDFPRLRLGGYGLTWGNIDTEIHYTSAIGDTVVTQRPSWKLSVRQNEMVHSISPPPSNQLVTIQMRQTEYPRMSMFSHMVRTNWYGWSSSLKRNETE
jgi:hypothetical protein